MLLSPATESIIEHTHTQKAQCNSIGIYHSIILIYLLRVNNSLSTKLLTLNESLMVKMGCLKLYSKITTMAWQKAVIKSK